MVFRQLSGLFGGGGPSVETEPASAHCRPGDHLAGEVRLQGGGQDVIVNEVALSLVTRVETEYGDHEGEAGLEFHRVAIAGGFTLGASEFRGVPFQLPLPWELPLTEVYGQHLHGMALGLRTDLDVAGRRDGGDLDPVSVVPLPSQQRVLDAFAALGFAFKGADLERGRIAGVDQALPFYQEIEFHPPHRYAGHVEEVELTFVADPSGMAVILEADRRGDLFSEGGDTFGRFHVSHDQALHMSWEQELIGWLEAVVGHLSGGHPGFAHAPYEHGHGSGGHGSGGHGSGGPSWGGVAAGAVGGAAAGFVAGAVVNELLDDDDDGDDDGDDGEDEGSGEFEAAAAAMYGNAVEEAVEAAYEDAYEDAYEAAYEDAAEAFEGGED
ncbi:sporulation protein [Spirillospora sp. NPDC029432]|uniref:sporulation protein n=1 Tax=Spirillospora sp. NPDC029432 TaxID=3154599 RepID=UPI003452195B